MTAPNGPILFNSSTGSDTQASGLGPDTAVFGTTGSCTSGSAVITGIDTTGVSVGDLFWGDTSSGRQFSIIASVDGATQVTLDDNLGATHSGNLTWAIGGKRATLNGADSRKLLDNADGNGDAYPGWTLQMESGFTDTITSTIRIRRGGDTTSGPITLQGDPDAAVRPVLTANFNGTMFMSGVGDRHHFKHFKAINTSATKTSTLFITQASGGLQLVVEDVIIGDSTNYFDKGINLPTVARINKCIIQYCSTCGIEITGSAVLVTENTIDNCNIGIRKSNTGYGSIILRNIIKNCTSHGYELAASSSTAASNGNITQNIFYNNGGCGLLFSTASVHTRQFECALIKENIFCLNGEYGFSAPNYNDIIFSAVGTVCDYNAFYSNTSGQMNGISNGDNDITLTVDPFVDAGNGDFNLNNLAGGGVLLRAATVTIS